MKCADGVIFLAIIEKELKRMLSELGDSQQKCHTWNEIKNQNNDEWSTNKNRNRQQTSRIRFGQHLFRPDYFISKRNG